MTPLYLAAITFFSGLVLSTAVVIATTLYHRKKGLHSFLLEQEGPVLLVRNNRLTVKCNAVSRFFLYSLFTFFIASADDMRKACIALALIYAICFIVVVLEFYTQASYKAILNRSRNSIRLGKNEYPLADWSLHIRKKKYRISEEDDGYGLFLQNRKGQTRLLYGYSILQDIEALKNELEANTMTTEKEWQADAYNRFPAVPATDPNRPGPVS
ncbi:MAG TPA: hypothetical protein VHK69_05360 [Chitinophagaceae bacterium]|jgi:Ca2+/Na+ antiporter|nr:hypothetical protein [Chitinophagaceae bacterium]